MCGSPLVGSRPETDPIQAMTVLDSHSGAWRSLWEGFAYMGARRSKAHLAEWYTYKKLLPRGFYQVGGEDLLKRNLTVPNS